MLALEGEKLGDLDSKILTLIYRCRMKAREKFTFSLPWRGSREDRHDDASDDEHEHEANQKLLFRIGRRDRATADRVRRRLRHGDDVQSDGGDQKGYERND